MNVSDRDVHSKKKKLGQYMTSPEVVSFCLDHMEFKYDQEMSFLEPSCGSGAFIKGVEERDPEANIIGIEVDASLLNFETKAKILNLNFYDFEDRFDGMKHVIGNPPYHTPAESITTHREKIDELRNKYGQTGLREESALFLLKTFDLLRGRGGRISMILPRVIFKNNSPVFTRLTTFMQSHLQLVSVWDLGNVFPGVMRDVVWANFEIGQYSDDFLLNGLPAKVSDYYGLADKMIPFQKIFKKTFLGSVPCESIFLSSKDETQYQFMDRLTNLFASEVNENNLLDLLSYEGEPHLRSLKNANPEKIATVLGYVQEVPKLPGFSIEMFNNEDNYKPIRHRTEDRWYFRHEFLKRASFVYQINPNPCPSFYFPGNPSAKSADYFGYCSYDVNRNSGPGANRTVPLEGVEDNLTESFKEFWRTHTNAPFSAVFDYLLGVSRSKWYSDVKSRNDRFYFGIPEVFSSDYWKLGCSKRVTCQAKGDDIDLTIGKDYLAVAEEGEFIRVFDDSDEDYLYPTRWFSDLKADV